VRAPRIRVGARRREERLLASLSLGRGAAWGGRPARRPGIRLSAHGGGMGEDLAVGWKRSGNRNEGRVTAERVTLDADILP
jgi:hypothetical protein